MHLLRLQLPRPNARVLVLQGFFLSIKLSFSNSCTVLSFLVKMAVATPRTTMPALASVMLGNA
ncbi:hypothetical protein EVA_20487 [gut metagenome]|uniref:Uncharacterized protein n=1 Tax=gut metagenome TaxID=749906 RepID=J9F925_9ZZZZ